MKLKSKMLLFILLPIFVVILVFSVVSYSYTNNLLIKDAKALMYVEANEIGSDIETTLAEKRAYIDVATSSLEKLIDQPDELYEYLKNLAKNLKDTLAIYVGYPDKRFFEGSGWSDPNFDPTSRSWYIGAKEKEGIVFSPPYINAMDGQIIITLSQRLTKNNEFVGVVGSDISMKVISDYVNNIKIKDNGNAFIVNEKGDFVIHHTYKPDENINTVENGAYSELNSFLTSSDETVIKKLNGTKKLYTKTPIKGTDWILVLEAPIKEITADSTSLAIFMSVIGVVSILILAIIVILTTHRIVKPILMLTTCIEGMVDYDFTLTEKSPSVIFSKNKDEIGIISRALIKVKNTIKDVIININDIANQVSAASEELTASSDQSASLAERVATAVNSIHNGVSLQAGNISKGNELMKVMSNALTDNENIINSLNLETESVLVAKENGLSTIRQLVEATEKSKNSAVKITSVIEGTNESAIAISVASDMIKSIADQTNLLALNAAIEAARAGEAGKGFAVVAEEIRKLAEQSNSFTTEIKDIVVDLNSKTSDAVSIMSQVGEIVSKQTDKVVETKEQFDLIASAIDKNRVEIDKLNTSKENLENTKDSLTDIISSLSSLSEKNSDSATLAAESTDRQTLSSQEVASASLNLATMSQEMIEMISKFRV